MAGYIVVIGVLLLFVIFCIKMIISTSKTQKQAKAEMSQKKANGVSLFIIAAHVNGLPVPENASCKISSYPDRYEFESSGAKFNVSKDKVTDVCVKTDVDIQKQYVSSIGGAVAGAVVFGPLGAIIGGRAKEKKSKEVHRYLIFTYQSDGEIKYTGFDIGFNMKVAQQFVNEFKVSNNGHMTAVEL